MDDTRFESSDGKRSLGRQVVVSRPLEDDDRISNVVLLLDLVNQLHGPVKIGFGVREPLGERQRIAGLDQHVEAPGLDLFALRLGLFDRLGQSGR